MEEEAKKLKHEADHEENMEVKCTKYLQVPETSLYTAVHVIVKENIEVKCTKYLQVPETSLCTAVHVIVEENMEVKCTK